jgi:AcrR family transcriptional regulator
MTDDTAPSLDRRIRRTRATLRDALIALILERGFDSITVQDITDRANLARATFYLLPR